MSLFYHYFLYRSDLMVVKVDIFHYIIKLLSDTGKQKWHTNKTKRALWYCTGSEVGGGAVLFVSIRQMTNSLLRFAFLRSDFTPPTPAVLNSAATFRARPYILMGVIQWFTRSNPSYPSFQWCSYDGRFWPELTVLADIEEEAPEITLPNLPDSPPHLIPPFLTLRM